MVTATPNRLIELELEAQALVDAEYRAIAKLPTTEMFTAINALTSRWKASAQAKYAAEIKAIAAKTLAQAQAGEALKVHALDVLGKVYKAELAESLGKLDTVSSLVFRVDRDGATLKLGEPTVTVGGVKKIPTGATGQARVHKVTVDSTEYASMDKAWKAMMPTTPKPTNRAECVTALQAANHTVS